MRRLLLQKARVILLVFIGVLLVAEAFARIYVVAEKPLQGHSMNFDQKYALVIPSSKKTLPKAPAMLVFGDSLVDHGIYAERLSQQLALKGVQVETFNLGVRAANLEIGLFLLKQAINAGKKPRWVMIGLNRNHLGRQDPLHDKAIRESYLGRCQLHPPQSLPQHIDCALASYSYLYRSRSTLQKLIQNTPNKLFKTEHYLLKRNIQPMSPHGWSPEYESMELENAIALHLKYTNKQPTSNFDMRLRQIVQYCNAEKISVVLVWMPRHPTELLDVGPEEIQYYRKVHDTIQREAGDWKIPFVDMEHAMTNYEDYHDLAHLNATGATRFTDLLAAELVKPAYASFWHTSNKKQAERATQ
jgi:hypothetical protein